MNREKIFWFGRQPTPEDIQVIKDHGFALEIPISGEIPDFRFGRMAIFWATDTYFGKAASSMKCFVAAALDEGLLIKVVVPARHDDLRLREITKLLQEIDPHRTKEGSYRVRTLPVDVHVLMHKAMQHDPGPAKNINLQIQCLQKLPESDVLLLQRAFHDCTDVRLDKISGGYSGARTYIVDASLSMSDAGRQPEPFFVKLGASDKLQEEISRFRSFAEHHIPWYLRPNFLPQRSIFGVNDAILVGNFVRGSVSLVECAQQGNGPPVIGCLFKETLANLYRQPRASDEDSSVSLEGALAAFSNYEKIPPHRITAAAVTFGGEEVGPQELWWQILSLPDQRWKNSSIHGDLHGENVRVRKSDAIVIDFAQACNAPACADLANLEVWLAFDLANDQFISEDWQSVINELYRPDAIGASMEKGFTSARGSWASDCVVEIRRNARELINSIDEYKRVLAVYLLRQASFPANPNNPDEDEFRRTYAYWLSCQLVAAMQVDSAVPVEATS